MIRFHNWETLIEVTAERRVEMVSFMILAAISQFYDFCLNQEFFC